MRSHRQRLPSADPERGMIASEVAIIFSSLLLLALLAVFAARVARQNTTAQSAADAAARAAATHLVAGDAQSAAVSAATANAGICDTITVNDFVFPSVTEFTPGVVELTVTCTVDNAVLGFGSRSITTAGVAAVEFWRPGRMTIQPGFSVSRRELQQKAPNLALSKRDDSSPHHLPNGGSADCRNSERGSVTAMVAIFAVAVVASVLLLFDASRRLNAMTSAQDLASETARYAAAFIDEDSVWSGTASISDEAVSEATAFAQAAGASEVVIEVAADGQSVIATITIDGGTPLIPGFDLEGTGQHRALVITS